MSDELAQEQRQVQTWPQFRQAFRQTVLFQAMIDAVVCELRCNDPPRVHVEARVRMQHQSGVAVSLWDRDCEGPTFHAVLVALLGELQEVTKATALRAQEQHHKNNRIVRAAEMPAGLGKDGRGLRIKRG